MNINFTQQEFLNIYIPEQIDFVVAKDQSLSVFEHKETKAHKDKVSKVAKNAVEKDKIHTVANVPVSGFKIASTPASNYSPVLYDYMNYRISEVTTKSVANLMSFCTLDRNEVLGECVWGVYENRAFIIPIGSDIHEQALINTARRNTSVTARELAPGNHFLNRDGTKGIYLGKFNILGKDYYYRSKGEWVTPDPIYSVLGKKYFFAYIDTSKKQDVLCLVKSMKISEITDSSTITEDEAEQQINKILNDKTMSLLVSARDIYDSGILYFSKYNDPTTINTKLHIVEVGTAGQLIRNFKESDMNEISEKYVFSKRRYNNLTDLQLYLDDTSKIYSIDANNLQQSLFGWNNKTGIPNTNNSVGVKVLDREEFFKTGRGKMTGNNSSNSYYYSPKISLNIPDTHKIYVKYYELTLPNGTVIFDTTE